MINSHLIHTKTRTAMAARDVLSIKRLGTVVALTWMLALGAGALAESPNAPAQKPAAAPVVAPAAVASKVNINTADAQTLASGLKGVGESRAMEIVRYREAYGPFASAD